MLPDVHRVCHKVFWWWFSYWSLNWERVLGADTVKCFDSLLLNTSAQQRQVYCTLTVSHLMAVSTSRNHVTSHVRVVTQPVHGTKSLSSPSSSESPSVSLCLFFFFFFLCLPCLWDLCLCEREWLWLWPWLEETAELLLRLRSELIVIDIFCELGGRVTERDCIFCKTAQRQILKVEILDMNVRR